jgi:hypothetical protein
VPELSANGRRSWRDSDWVGLLPSALAFVFMALLSWRKWPDPIIDFGGQLYIPWQLSTGSVLYRDVMYLPGPASQYYHALLFKLFGVSFSTIIASNLLILIGFVVLVYRLFLKCSDRLTAGGMSLAIVIGFGFAQYLDVGNYNYMAPYSHEIWHGIVLSVVMIACAARWLETRGDKWVVLGGLCYGILFLQKPENFVAASVIPGLTVILSRLYPLSLELAPGRKKGLRSGLLFLIGGFVPIVIQFFIFRRGEDAAQSLRGVCGAWVPLVTTKMSTGAFFRTGMGMDVPWFHAKWMLAHFIVVLAVIGVCAWRFRPTQNRIERIVLFCLLAGLAINFDWTHCGRSLPLILLCALVTLFLEWKRSEGELRKQWVVPILWLSFALLLLLKMGLYPRIVHYGVFLAMPAALGAFYFLLWLLPRRWAGKIDARQFRLLVSLLLAIGLGRLAVQSALFYRDKAFSVGKGGDRFVTYHPKISPEGQGIDLAISWLETNAAPGTTVAALPEGVMINYQLRVRNPTPYIVFMSEIYAFGEERMAAPYRASPPDYILLVHRETAEYGLRFFGQEKGYGKEMLEWIQANYSPVHLIGAEPLQTGDFGIKIYKKKML